MISENVQRRLGAFLAIVLAFSLIIPALVTAAPTRIVEEDDAAETATTIPKSSHRLIVQLGSPSLAEWSAATSEGRGPDGRLNLQSEAAQAYLAQIEAEQAAFVSRMTAAVPTASVAAYLNEAGQTVEATYQIVFNGLAIDPGATDTVQAQRALHEIEGVRAVFADYAHDPQLYASLPLINAPALWAEVGGQANAGSGVKVASMDGGVHHDAPMFDGTGYNYPPGFPSNGLGDPANNNGKIIASRAYFRTWDPPAVGDENTWPGVNGTSHGVHTAGIAAGNPVVADYLGATESISGVAPGAWVMSYRMFYASVSGDGSFYTVEGIAALEDIVADGADVLNNSWGAGPSSAGGEFDPLDAALINAANAGIFISMSAGNAGPGAGTTDHPSEEYINVAATTTTGTYAAGRLSVTAPEPVPANLEDMPYAAATFGDPLPLGTVITHTYVTAGSVDPGNVEGCNPWAGTPFTGEAVLISRGSCEFGVKVLNAENAGAEFVVVYNNAGEELVSMAPGAVGDQVTISSIIVGQTNGEAMVDWYDSNPGQAELTVDTNAFQVGNDPDIVANFSSRGPGVGNVGKPDIAAPGVNILSQGYDPTATGEARHLGFGQVSGTSMAAPHVAGAAALLRQIHPDWSNAYIKSALMTTAKYMEVYNLDGSPAQPLDMGAGRLDLTNAADPGVILSPPSLSYGYMMTGTTTSIQVMATSVADTSETYDLSTLYTGASFTMTSPLDGFTVTPSSITLAPGASTTFTVTFDSAMGMGIGDNQGYIILDGDTYEAHMPAWARVTPQPAAEVLVIDNDHSFLLGFPDYRAYYTDALDELGISWEVWHADANFNNPTSLPSAAELAAYEAIIYFTGDAYQPNGTFTVATPLTSLDMNILTEYANAGGIIIAMGQDMSWILDDSFFQGFVLGVERLQDSLTNGNLPTLPIVGLVEAAPAFDDVALNLGGATLTAVTLTGANEVPPVATTASGEAFFGYNVATGELDYFVEVNVTDPLTITASHIHTGTAGVNGPVIHPLWTTPTLVTDTLTFSGQVTLSPDEEEALMNNALYINVHSTDNPGGEIRAQVVAGESGDGAGNQYWIDELERDPGEPDNPPGMPDQYYPLLRYPGPYNVEEGIVAVAHRDQPTLERPGVSYDGRSIAASFGLEGVNNGLNSTSREELLDKFLNWARDEPTVTITDLSSSYDGTSQVVVFEATVSSNISGTTGISYRWDFGDGSPYAGPYESEMASHSYDVCGPYTVRVEAVDSWGNRAIGTQEIMVEQGCESVYRSYLPIVPNE